MADDLSRMWANFYLLEEKDEKVDARVQVTDFQEVTIRGQDCVVGKLVGDEQGDNQEHPTTMVEAHGNYELPSPGRKPVHH